MPPAPQPRGRRTAVAVAVAFAIGSSALWWWSRPATHDDHADLIAATSRLRPGPIRLSGFPHVPLPLAARSLGTKPGRQLLAVARRVEKEADTNPTPGALHLLGLVHLFVGELGEAADDLRRAHRAAPSDGSIDDDLAAALIQRSHQEHAPAFAAEGLEVLLRSAASERHAEALFDEALALEALGLRREAIATWQRYLRLDGRSEWAEEARARVAALRAADATADQTSPEWLEQEVLERDLADWAGASTAGDALRARRSLAAADQVAAHHAELTGDPLLPSILQSIHGAAPATLAQLAAGHRAYALARRAYASQHVASCRLEAERAVALLGAQGSPAAALATLTWGSCDFLASELEQAEHQAHSSAAIAAKASHPSLLVRAQADWLTGLVEHARNRPADSLVSYLRGLEELRRAHDRSREASLRTLVAYLYDYLGRTDAAWEEATAAVRLEGSIPRRRYRALGALAQLARRQALPHVALEVARAMRAAALSTGLRDFACESYLEEGRAATLAGRPAAAADAFQAALGEAEALGDPDLRARYFAHAAIELARTMAASDPGRAKRLLADIDTLATREADLYLDTAFVGSRIERREGNTKAAETTLRLAIARSDHELDELGLRDRDDLFDQRKEVHYALVRLLADQGRAGDALEVLESWRSLAFARSNSTAVPSGALGSRLRGRSILAYLCLDDELLVWKLVDDSVKLARHPITRRALAELRLGGQLRSRARKPARARGADVELPATG